MRIVSQDRTISFNFDHITLWTQSNVLYAKSGSDSKVIGNYESEECAAEVFEDIHNAYAPVAVIVENMNQAQCAELIKSQNVKANVLTISQEMGCITTYDDRVYYMPEE